jgi:MATE family multidrug resistance protein
MPALSVSQEARPAPVTTWRGELFRLFAIGWPLIVAQVARNSLFLCDIIMMGWLGSKFIAAGSLATSFFNPFLLFGVGVLGAIAPLVAQALGRRDLRSMRRTVRQGFWVAIALGAVLVPIVWQLRPIFAVLGQDPEISILAEGFVHYAAWLFFPALMTVVLHCFLAAHGDTRIILVITLLGVVLNAIFNYALMFGNWGFPRLELIGSGIATALVNWLMFAATLGYVLTHRHYRRYHLLGRFWRPDWSRFFTILRIGTPIGFTVMSEVGLFGFAAILMGWLGTSELAAHAVALQCGSLAFMIPLGLSQATTARVGLAFGRQDSEAIRKAGWVSLFVGAVFSMSTCIVFLTIPHFLVGLFLDRNDAANTMALGLAATYLGVAAVFQLVDGAQVIAAASLRGLSDTKVPMITAIIGYWVIGFPVAYVFGFILGMRGVGVWFGLAAGLAVVAVVLTIRFAMREKLGLVRFDEAGRNAAREAQGGESWSGSA